MDININITVNGQDCSTEPQLNVPQLLTDLKNIKETAMALITQEQLNTYSAAVNTATDAANTAAQSEAAEVAAVIGQLQTIVAGGASDPTALEAAITRLQGIQANISNIYVAPVEPPQPEEEPVPEA